MFSMLWQVFQGTPSEPDSPPLLSWGSAQVQEGRQSGWQPPRPQRSHSACSAVTREGVWLSPARGLCGDRETRLQRPLGWRSPELPGPGGRRLREGPWASGSWPPAARAYQPHSLWPRPCGRLVPRQAGGCRAPELSWLWPRFQHPGTMALGQAVQVPLNPPAQRSPRPSQMPQPQRRDRPLGRVMGQKGLAAGPAHSLRERPPSVATRLALRLLNQEGRGHLLWAPWPPGGSGA